MKSNENRKKLFDHIKKEMADDRAKHKILHIAKFGFDANKPRQRFQTRTQYQYQRNQSGGLGHKGETDALLHFLAKIEKIVKPNG